MSDKQVTAGQLCKALESYADDAPVPLHVSYGDVCNEYVFVRTDSLTADETGLKLQVSLVDPEDEDEDDGNEIEEGTLCERCGKPASEKINDEVLCIDCAMEADENPDHFYGEADEDDEDEDDPLDLDPGAAERADAQETELNKRLEGGE